MRVTTTIKAKGVLTGTYNTNGEALAMVEYLTEKKKDEGEAIICFKVEKIAGLWCVYEIIPVSEVTA